ncbi:hypothetical protein CI109_100760 [Kwoniella shandongensis]|uniref:Uncharacterized protein n=1 Tax=Kwoniella shandongensis TaxID=1734106 RepID=A0A5M6BWZ2_9TREE|nr:uncharacterized protein CI109_005061 [Kwoniella shandongensis]KAA5526670.1 hypothetical protein CI109_005061 [Kwoniella shandongensis]
MSLRTSINSTRALRTKSIVKPSNLYRSIVTAHRPVVSPTTVKQYRMASSVIQATAKAAHSTFASLVSASPIKVGDAIPDVEVRINGLEEKVNFSKLTGKNVLVLVPGAFSGTCSQQVPGYIKHFSAYQSKGVKDVYVVAVNDIFVVNAWKENLTEGKGETVKFAADDSAALAHALGLVLDGQAIFGGPRLKRGAIVFDNGKVTHLTVEPNPGEVTTSHADEVLKAL